MSAKKVIEIQAQTEDTDMARTPAATPAPTKPASILSGLKFSTAKRSSAVNIADPTIRARTKMVEAIKGMILFAQAEIAGEDYNPTISKYITNDQGQRVKVEQPKRKLLWYWKEGGAYMTEIRYGSSAVDFGSGSSIECGPQLADVVEVYDTVIQAVEQGEIDQELMKLSERRGRARAEQQAAPASPRERIAARTTRR